MGLRKGLEAKCWHGREVEGQEVAASLVVWVSAWENRRPGEVGWLWALGRMAIGNPGGRTKQWSLICPCGPLWAGPVLDPAGDGNGPSSLPSGSLGTDAGERQCGWKGL